MSSRKTIIHVSDIHLGKNRKYTDYLEQQRFMLEAIFKIVKDILDNANGEEVWFLFVGDLFDRNEDTLLDEFSLGMTHFLFPLLELEKKYPNFEWYVEDGNHDRRPYDPTDPESSCSVLSPLKKFAPNRIIVQSPVYIDKLNLLLVPFNGYDERELRAILDVYPQAKYLCIHECLNTIKTDKGWTPRKQEKYIDIKNIIRDYKFSGIFVGDIHRSQCLDDDGICWYSGSPSTLDFSHEMPKGVLIHVYEDDKPISHTLVPLNDPRIKIHKNLGILKNPEDLPLKEISQFENVYCQLMVSPEAYSVIDKKFPNFFHSPNISWEFPRPKPNLSVEIKEEYEGSEFTPYYYATLLDQWIEDNTKTLCEEEKVILKEKLLKDFSER